MNLQSHQAIKREQFFFAISRPRDDAKQLVILIGDTRLAEWHPMMVIHLYGLCRQRVPSLADLRNVMLF